MLCESDGLRPAAARPRPRLATRRHRARSAAQSTSMRVSSQAAVAARGRLARVSASACGLDQRTSVNRLLRGNEGPVRRKPMSQYPPSAAGPNTTSSRRNALNAAATWRHPSAGMSLPTITAGPGGSARNTRAIRRPRSPVPCGARSTPPGQKPGPRAKRSRRDREPAAPARIPRDAGDEPRRRAPVELPRRHRTGLAGEPGFDRRHLGRLDEDHQVIGRPRARPSHRS